MKIHYVTNPALFSFSVGSQILFDHSQKIMYMKPEEVLAEYTYLLSPAAQEKDERKGISMGLSPEKQVRLEQLKSYIEGAVSLLQTATKKVLLPRFTQTEEIMYLSAKNLSGKDWHVLNSNEKALAELLYASGHLIRRTPANSFVGRIDGGVTETLMVPSNEPRPVKGEIGVFEEVLVPQNS